MLATVSAQAADVILKPFVLASKGAGTVAEKTEQAKSALTGAGFTVVGNYSPYADAQILIVTSDELKKNAAASEHGGYGAVQRVAITKVKQRGAGQLYQSGLHGQRVSHEGRPQRHVSRAGTAPWAVSRNSARRA